MKRRDFISGLLGFLAAVPILGWLFKKKPAGMQSRAMKEWIAEQPNPEDYKDTFDLYNSQRAGKTDPAMFINTDLEGGYLINQRVHKQLDHHVQNTLVKSIQEIKLGGSGLIK